MTTSPILKALQRPVAPAAAFRAAWMWWWRHLIATLSAVTPHYLKERVLSLEVVASGDGLQVHTVPGSAVHLAFIRGTAPDHALRRRVEEASVKSRADRIMGILRPAPSDLLRKRISLPAAAAGNLAEAVGYQIELETPFRASEVYYGFRLWSQTPSILHVEIAVALRKTIDTLISSATELGIPMSRVYDGASASDPQSIELLSRPTQWPRTVGRTLLLSSSLLAILIAAMAILPLALKAHEVAQLEARAAANVKLAEPVLAEQRQLAVRLKRRSAFTSLMQRYPDPLKVLDALTRTIPEETWLTNLAMHTGEIRISGLTPSTSALIDELAATGLFYPPSYGAPTVQDSEFERERFVLTVRLKPSL